MLLLCPNLLVLDANSLYVNHQESRGVNVKTVSFCDLRLFIQKMGFQRYRCGAIETSLPAVGVVSHALLWCIQAVSLPVVTVRSCQIWIHPTGYLGAVYLPG